MSGDGWMDPKARAKRELDDWRESNEVSDLKTWIAIRTLHALHDIESTLDGIREQLANIAARIERRDT